MSDSRELTEQVWDQYIDEGEGRDEFSIAGISKALDAAVATACAPLQAAIRIRNRQDTS